MSEVRTLAVIGAGNMGSGIAQKMATEGFQVLLVDLDEAQVDRGIGIIRKTLDEGVARRIFREGQVYEILGRVRKTVDWAELAQADLIVEAVFEDLRRQARGVRAARAACAKPDAVLATNTSSFYVRDLAKAATASRARARPALLLSPGEEPPRRGHPDARGDRRPRSRALGDPGRARQDADRSAPTRPASSSTATSCRG